MIGARSGLPANDFGSSFMKLFLALALSLAALSAPPVQAQTTVGEAARAIGAANDLVAAMKG